MSTLCGRANGLCFNELKDECDLTDGNLSRHLKTLEEAAMVRIEKSFVGVKPRTTVVVTNTGRSNFLDYLTALEEVLKMAAGAIGSEAEGLSISEHFGNPIQI
jgi:DNA-binding MarR family transcriptional regulator